jgi:hypothetical protein
VSRPSILAGLMLAYMLTVLVSLGWFVALSFSGTSLTLIEVSLSILLVLISVLNTPLTLFLKGKPAIRLFYAYHIAVQCLLIATMVVGLLTQPLEGQSATMLGSRGLFLGIYVLSVWGLASQYGKNIQREREAGRPRLRRPPPCQRS